MKNSSKVKHICIVTEFWPTADDPMYTFVRQLVCAIADLGVTCSVIAPQSISRTFLRGKANRPFYWSDTSKAGSRIDIYQPRYVSFSNFKVLRSMTNILFRKVALRAFSRLKEKPDAIYAHFWHSGITAAMIGQRYDLPVFIATGESKITVRDRFSKKTVDNCAEAVSGVICVSTKNLEESVNLKLTTPHKAIVLPNSIDSAVFYPEDKMMLRAQLGFDGYDFIVAFTGAFSDRKGILRLSEALKERNDVKSIFIGSGEQRPDNDGILFCGKLPHEEVVHYLNAADVFVLPTKAEGCCNAIIEAMACGLPIISSDLSFNDDILDGTCSVRIDPNKIDEIAAAIKLLHDNKNLRLKLADGALKKSKDLHICARAEKIIDFINSKI